LYINSCRSSISPPVLHFLHEFYEMVAFFLNTVIFLIAGCKLGTLLVNSSFHDLYETGSGSWGMIFGIYPIILFARGITMVICYPLLKNLGTGCTWQEAIVMWWGGLRGSVGLALALAVHHTVYDKAMWGNGFDTRWKKTLVIPTLNCRDQPQMVLVLILFVVLTTVVINGITMAPLMKILKLTQIPEDRQFMLKRAKTKLDQKSIKAVADLRKEYGPYLKDFNWDSPDVLKAGSAFTHAENCKNTTITDDKRCTWLLVLSLERAFYLVLFEAGSLGDHAFAVLERTMADTQAHAQLTPTDSLGKVYDEHFDALLKTLRSMDPAEGFEAGLAYIGAQHEAEHLTAHDHDTAEGEELHLARKHVKEEHADNVHKMQDLIEELRQKSPIRVRKFAMKFVATQLLRKQRALVEHMKHEGELIDLDSGPLIGEIDVLLEKRIIGKKAIGTENLIASASDFLGETGEIAAGASNAIIGTATREATRAVDSAQVEIVSSK